MFEISIEDGLVFDLAFASQRYPLTRVDFDTVAWSDCWGNDWFATLNAEGSWNIQREHIEGLETLAAA